MFQTDNRHLIRWVAGALTLAGLCLLLAGVASGTAAASGDETAEGPLWSADMSVVDLSNGSIGAVSANLFSNQEGSAGLQAKWLWYYTPERKLRLAFTEVVPGTEELTLQVGDLVLAIDPGESSFSWTDIDVDWEDGQTLSARIVRRSAINTPATGMPTINGVAWVGRTLKADTSGIGDVDGLDYGTLTYQWVANDGNTDADLEEATASTYDVSVDDVNKTLKVRVSFTDGFGTEESLTSEATAAVELPTNFPAGGAPSVSGQPVVQETLTADTSGIQDANGVDNATFIYQWIRNDGDTDTDIEGATGPTYEVSDSDFGKTIKVRVSFADTDRFAESLTSAPTASVEMPTNVPASGAPTITGRLVVRDILTADTSGIQDANGMGDAIFIYQWIRNDGSADTDIENATGPTYELSDADLGKTIKVRVSFNDRNGFAESLTSAPTVTVMAVPSGPRNVSVSQKDNEDEELVVSWESPVSDGGSAVFRYVVQWRSGSQDFGPSRQETTYGTASEHILRGLDTDVTYTVRVFAVNGIGDGDFSEEVAERLFSNEMRLNRMIQENLVDIYEDARPWLRDTWQHMNEPEFDVEVEIVPAGSTTSYAAYVLVGCYLYFDDPLRKCDVDKMVFVYEYIGSRLVATHEMAHIYTLTNGLVADPAPLAMAHVYVDRLDLQGRYCRPLELYADLVTLDLISLIEDDFEDPLNRLPYWEHCNPDYDGNFQPPYDSLTEEALGVVRSALNGQMPQWFSDTYDDAKGNPDLEQLWTDIGALEYYQRAVVVYQLRGTFGGYCDGRRTTKALSSGSTDTRNPWRDGGCVPGAPGNLIATESDGELTLSWEQPDSDGGSRIQAYRVEWKSESEDYDASRQQMVTDRGSRLSHTVTGLTNGTDYTVRVLAVNHNGDGAHSVVTATPHDTDSPAIVAAAGAGRTLTLNLTGALDGESVPSSSVFEVAVADQTVSVTEVSIQGSTMTLKLASAMEWNDEVTLEYSVPLEIDASRIQDAAGLGALSFSVAVANHTPAAGNRAANGTPTIDGVVEVGKTLTASVSDVGDADGVTGATFKYQWLSNDGTLDTYILGATASSYKLAAPDAGKTIQVRVTFTDDGGTLEALTSAANG